jgi:oligoribonuclease
VSERTGDNLIWIDMEFSHLDPNVGSICQAAMIVTGPDLTPLPPPGIDPRVGGLLYDIRIEQRHVDHASEWVRAHQADQLKRSLEGEDALPVETVEELFIGYLLATCEVPENKALRPILAGNSVHGDQRYIKKQMPRLDELLSFRLLDVTTLKELARRWAPRLVFSKNDETIKQWYPGDIELKGGAHDALYDIKGSIAELCFYRKTVLAQALHPQG